MPSGISASLRVQAIRTPLLRADSNLVEVVVEALKAFPESELEGSILAVTSKILSVVEGRLVLRDPNPENWKVQKRSLVKHESEALLGQVDEMDLTIKHGNLIFSAGLDESNSETGGFLLLPERPFHSAGSLRQELMAKLRLKCFGILLTDSRTLPLRRGNSGFALAHSGFRGSVSHQGQPDLFGRPLRKTVVGIADSLAAAAVLCMGETNERTPLALIHSSAVEFVDSVTPYECSVAPGEDLYLKALGVSDVTSQSAAECSPHPN